MSGFENIITVVFGLLLLSLFVWIRSPRGFLVVGLLALLLAGVAIWLYSAEWINLVIFLAGGGMLVVGLGFVRVMLIRSVSLGALSAIARHVQQRQAADIESMQAAQIAAEIKSRVHDMERHRLVLREDDRLSLTRWGRLIAVIVWVLTSSLRLKR